MFPDDGNRAPGVSSPMTHAVPFRTTRRRFIQGGACLALGAGLVSVLNGCSNEPPKPVEGAAPKVRGRTPSGEKRGAPGNLRLGLVRPGAPDTPPLTDLESLLVHARLVAVDPRDGSVHGDLATALEQPEPTVLRFTLDDHARFHAREGEQPRPVTAEAVKVSFERRAAEGVPLFSQVIERVEAPDKGHVVLRLRAPFALLFELLGAVPAAVTSDAKYEGIDERVGAGAFVPVAREGATQRLVANPLLKGDSAPRLAQITITGAGLERDLDLAFAHGHIDVRRHQDEPGVLIGGGRDGRTLVRRPATRMRGLGLSLVGRKDGREVRSVSAFQDQRVRRALSYAIDRASLRRADNAFAAGPVGPAHAADALPPADVEAHPLFQYRPDEAARLLQAAAQGGLAFTVVHPDIPAMLPLVKAVGESLAQGGFAPRMQSMPFATWQATLAAGDFEATLVELTNLETPDLGLRLHQSGGLDGRFSPWGYSNPVYDAAVLEALRQLDPAARAQKSREAQRLLLEDVPAMLPIYAPGEAISVAKGVSGYVAEAYDFNTAYLAREWATSA
ncbi:MAG: ABC transporter substrate-binding protein [Dehalococcoidia bacterium]|nr:MAG: ABC transporter substrate-binding protein [Dehalococcoidia bacterium]